MFVSINKEFEDKFARIVIATREYFTKIINKLEDTFEGVLLGNLYDYPQLILEELEKESNLKWDDDIWDSIFNPEVSPQSILENILNKRVKEFKKEVIEEWEFTHKLSKADITELSEEHLTDEKIKDAIFNNFNPVVFASVTLE